MTRVPHHSMQPTGASRSGQPQFPRQWRLAPAAHAERYPRCAYG